MKFVVIASICYVTYSIGLNRLMSGHIHQGYWLMGLAFAGLLPTAVYLVYREWRS